MQVQSIGTYIHYARCKVCQLIRSVRIQLAKIQSDHLQAVKKVSCKNGLLFIRHFQGSLGSKLDMCFTLVPQTLFYQNTITLD